MTKLEILEDKAEYLHERLIETDPASNNYDELRDEIKMLKKEIELEMNDRDCPICGGEMETVAVQAARVIRYCPECGVHHHTLRRADGGHDDPLKAWVFEGDEQ